MIQIYPDLWQTKTEHPFPGVNSHAYFYTKNDGNILLYNTSKHEDYPVMKGLGGVAYQFLSHMDEAGASLKDIRAEFGAKLCCHRREEKYIAKTVSVDCLFDQQQIIGNVTIIPTPGHTAGSVCFLIDSDFGEKYLFTGDTIYFDHGKLACRINGYGGSSKTDLLQSLAALQKVRPTVVLCSASVGNVALREFAADQWAAEVEDLINGLR